MKFDLTALAAHRVELRPVFDAQRRKVDHHFGVYNVASARCVDIVGRAFRPVQHIDVVRPVIEQVEARGYELSPMPADTSLRDGLAEIAGRKAGYVKIAMDDGGAKLRTEIILGDHIVVPSSQMHGAMDALRQRDLNLLRLSVFNSHDQSWAVKANQSYLRVLCLNGMTSAAFSASAYGKHTVGFDLKALHAKVATAFEAIHEDRERFALWARTQITVAQAATVVRQTIALTGVDPEGNPKVSDRLVTNILERFGQEDQTVWGLYNAVTGWQSHEAVRANAGKLTTRVSREQRVAGMLRAPEWEALAA